MKKLNIYFLISFIICGLFIVSCRNKHNKNIDEAELSNRIQASIGWALNKDLNLLYDVVANDSNFFIYHPDIRSN